MRRSIKTDESKTLYALVKIKVHPNNNPLRLRKLLECVLNLDDADAEFAYVSPDIAEVLAKGIQHE